MHHSLFIFLLYVLEFTISSEDESSTTGLLIAMLHSDSDIETRYILCLGTFLITTGVHDIYDSSIKYTSAATTINSSMPNDVKRYKYIILYSGHPRNSANDSGHTFRKPIKSGCLLLHRNCTECTFSNTFLK